MGEYTEDKMVYTVRFGKNPSRKHDARISNGQEFSTFIEACLAAALVAAETQAAMVQVFAGEGLEAPMVATFEWAPNSDRYTGGLVEAYTMNAGDGRLDNIAATIAAGVNAHLRIDKLYSETAGR